MKLITYVSSRTLVNAVKFYQNNILGCELSDCLLWYATTELTSTRNYLCGKNPSENRLTKEMSTFYRSRGFITVLKSPPLLSNLREINPAYIFPNHFLKINFNIILFLLPALGMVSFLQAFKSSTSVQLKLIFLDIHVVTQKWRCWRI